MATKVNAKSAGSSPRGTALDPRIPSLVQPFKRLVEEGYITELVVKFTPSGTTSLGKPDQRMVDVDKSGLVIDQAYPLGLLLAVSDKGNLVPVKGKKKTAAQAAQPLPEKTLTKDDLGKTPDELLARARAVANKSGGATLVGRVRSANRFGGSATISFENWWKTADAVSRASSLMTTKKLAELDQAQIDKFGSLQCPFRGTAEFTVIENAQASGSS
jgi:hypothetical protein